MVIRKFVVQFVFISIISFLIFPVIASSEEKKSELIILSSLSTPPPGYIIGKSFGTFGDVEFHEMTVFFGGEIKKGVIKKISEIEQRIKEYAIKIGANAILSERIDVQFTPGSGKVHFLVFIQGEPVVLNPVQ